MAVELDGNVRMRGDTGPGVGVRVVAGDRRIKLVSGNELVGDWSVSEIGISALNDGFNIKAEGEEFVLRTEDDVAFADELGVAAASPRLARRIAARHNPEESQASTEQPPISTNLAAIGFALAGALVILGGTLLSEGDALAPAGSGDGPGSALDFWLVFLMGGILMVATAYVMSIGIRFARIIATVLLIAMIVTFGFAVTDLNANTTELTAYGFIAGGLVVGIAVLFSGALRSEE